MADTRPHQGPAPQRTALPPAEIALLATLLAAHPAASNAEITRYFNAQVQADRDPKTVRKAIALSGLAVPPSASGKGRPTTLTSALRDQAAALARAQPAASLTELVVAFKKATGVECCAATLGKALRKCGIVRPKGRHHPTQSKSAGPSPTRYKPHHRVQPSLDRRGYPSDLTDEQWELVEPLLRPTRRREPCAASTRMIVDALLYMARTGCQWRFIPNDLPKWESVAQQFYRWEKRGVWKAMNDALRTEVRLSSGKTAHPTAAIIDSQSVKTTEKGGSADTTQGSDWSEERGIFSSIHSD